jgi:hypothetical protein
LAQKKSLDRGVGHWFVVNKLNGMAQGFGAIRQDMFRRGESKKT